MTYAIIQSITQKFINNELQWNMIRGSHLCITGKENSSLMQETQFISNLYIGSKPVEVGKQDNVGLYNVNIFAGSENGGVNVTSPILPEVSTTRYCMALAPESVAMAMEIGDISVEKNPLKVNSMDITIDLWINAMRTEGARVILVTTTI